MIFLSARVPHIQQTRGSKAEVFERVDFDRRFGDIFCRSEYSTMRDEVIEVGAREFMGEKEIYIWGFGKYYLKNRTHILCDGKVSGFIATHKFCNIFEGRAIYEPSDIDPQKVEFVIVATSYTDEIIKSCLSEDIFHKLIFMYPTPLAVMLGLCDGKTPAYSVFDQDFMEEYERNVVAIKNSRFMPMPSVFMNSEKYHDIFDVVRVMTLELIYEEINAVKGEVAELGVFAGDFARHINRLWCDRQLFLFDSFEGFSEEQLVEACETTKSDYWFRWAEDFKYTNVKLVMEKMKHKNQVKICKGFFPDTTNMVSGDIRFAFVSIDVDLEQNTLAGLRYFYPRLNTHGMMMIHDCFLGNPKESTLVRRAIRKYEDEIGQKLCKVPIADAFGSIVIVKP